jgi:plasmid maintenance system antidote protein VapI
VDGDRPRRGTGADTALRLARYFGGDARSWLNLQANYDMQCAQDAAGATIARIAPRVHDSGRSRDNLTNH